jgi:fimbrial chaperone protein
MSVAGALRWGLAAAIAAASSWAVAASFALSPLGLSIKPGEVSGSVTVTNTGTEAIVIQARAYAWAQNEQETRSETRNLIINPPIFKLGAGEQQLVRVGSRRPTPNDTEEAYRLIFTEIPLASAKPAAGLQISLAMDIPVYITPSEQAAPETAWNIALSAAGAPRLVATNRGGSHYRLRDVKLMDGSREIVSFSRLVVLARSRFALDLPDSVKDATAMRLTGHDDENRPVTIDLTTSSR